jgi:hypothetical protein
MTYRVCLIADNHGNIIQSVYVQRIRYIKIVFQKQK